MIPEKQIEIKTKMKEYNNKFFQERIDAKRKEITQLEADIERLQGKIDFNLSEIDKLKEI
jgi:peptidoglycan hydrolase CwlO-like protein